MEDLRRTQNNRDRNQNKKNDLNQNQEMRYKETRRNVSRPRTDRFDEMSYNDFLRNSPDLYERGAE
ncbi:MAG TPA: hypothetical protein VJT83_08705 [Chitinophagaceae bacterium]|nr:hypothetical protein [Chitinophagaceae bacterium]